MRSVLLRFVSSLLAFTFGVVCVWILGLGSIDSPARDHPQQVEALPPVIYNSVHFEPSCTCQDLPSTALAKRALREKLKYSGGLWCYNSKEIRREPKLDVAGRQVGRRVVAIIGCGEEGQTYAVIWWTEGSTFCEIEAPFLYQAEDVERARKQWFD